MSSNAGGGFALLPSIRTQKPRLPDDTNLEDLDSEKLFPQTRVAKACGRSGSPGSVSIAVSTDFQDLIDRLVEQHVKEISGKEQFCERNEPGCHERPGGGRGKADSFAFTASSGTESMHSVATSQSRQSRSESKQRQSLTSLTGILREKHKDMREIHASDILDAWNDSITTTMFRDPLLATLQKIALVLCVNVMWMAFELQLYGSLAGWGSWGVGTGGGQTELPGVELEIYDRALVAAETLDDVEAVLQAVDIGFTCLFVFDVLLRICVLGRRHLEALPFEFRNSPAAFPCFSWLLLRILDGNHELCRPCC
eukprot:Skav208974  [mRNA]  locus=scaffold1039:17074:18373:+ [translate_table: standard]